MESSVSTTPRAAARSASHDDTAIFDLIAREKQRQLHGLELIASENFVSAQVMAAMGSELTNKYAEGLPGKRYYGGCEIVDQVEQLAIDRLKELFGAAWANVQPHSGRHQPPVGADCEGLAQQPARALPHHHHHHAQNAARAARGRDFDAARF